MKYKSDEVVVTRDVLVNLHNYLIHDAGYLHALANDHNQDDQTRQWARRVSMRNVWIATELALEIAMPTMRIDGYSLWASSR